MIRLDRKKVVAPKILADEDGAGQDERARAIKHFTDKETRDQAFEFKAYRAKEVKEALIRLSHGKCAYCETMEGGSDYDIEHFRPKGEVSGPDQEKVELGYYWLASDWNNLYLSCMHCNQKRMQTMLDGKIVSSGKKNQFPLKSEKFRAKNYDADLKKEEKARLLLDPGVDHPEKHLRFVERMEMDEDGRERVMPAVDSTSEKGERSLLVFGLNRKQLAEVRLVHYNNLRDKLKLIEDMIIEYNENEPFLPAERKEASKKKIYQRMEELAAQCEDETQPFTAMARFFKEAHLKRFSNHTTLKDIFVRG